MKYHLTQDLLTGDPRIDREHQELFEAINALMAACAKGQGRAAMEDAIAFLSDYVHTHFAHEEALQRRSAYPGYAAHKAFHDQYRRRLQEIVDAIPPAGPGMMDLSNINGHVAKLISHIRTEDKRLGAYLAVSALSQGLEMRKKIS